MITPQAFIFDLNGTMINDMEYHTRAWYGILNNDLQANLSWDAVKKEMYGKNEELLVRVFGDRYPMAEMVRISQEKEKAYQQAYRPHLALLDGLDDFLKTATQRGVHLAIGSAAVRMNVDFVLDGLHIRDCFAAIVCADDVAQSKPDPETFLKAAQQLHADPKQCVVFEDAPKGVEAAQNAGMPVVVVTTMHSEEVFAAYTNVLAFVSDYTDPVLNQLFEKNLLLDAGVAQLNQA